MTRLAVVTVIHDSEADLERLLDSLHLLPGPAPQTVVVDSGSRDRGAALARDRGAEVIDLGANQGFGAGCNAGLRLVHEPVVALLNPDVELLDGGLAALAAEAGTREALLAPRMLNTDASVQDSAHPPPGTPTAVACAALPRRALPRPLRLHVEPWRSDAPRTVGWAIGACLVAQTGLLRRLGPFDPAAFLFYEDLELCLRAGHAGAPTLLRPAVALRHRGGGSVVPAFAGADLELRARRRREVLAREGRRRLALDDAEQALTFASRAMAGALPRTDRTRERAQLRALWRAMRAGA